VEVSISWQFKVASFFHSSVDTSANSIVLFKMVGGMEGIRKSNREAEFDQSTIIYTNKNYEK
jgi:hypothetical protein